MSEPNVPTSTELELITNSRRACFQACARKEYITYQLGYRAVRPAQPLRFGTFGHRASGGYFIARKDYPGRPELWVERVMDELSVDRENLEPFARAKCQAMVLGWMEGWNARQIEVIGVETEFRMPLVNPESGKASVTFEKGGKLDVLIHMPRVKENAIVEHKFLSTSCEVGTTRRAQLDMDSQCDMYFDGSDALGHSASRVLYDVLVKPALKPLQATPEDKRVMVREKVKLPKPKVGKYRKPARELGEDKDAYAARSATARGAYDLDKASVLAEYAERVRAAQADAPTRLKGKQRAEDETPDAYQERVVQAIKAAPGKHYQVVSVPRLEARAQEHAYDLWQVGRSIADSRRLNRHPRNPDACFRYGAPCEFWGVCRGEASLDDPTKFRRATSVHEELDGGEEMAAAER